MAKFPKLQAGAPLTAVTGAAYHNAIRDALKWVDAQRNKTGAGGAQRLQVPGTVVWVQNSSDEDVDRFGILGISAPTIMPADNLGGFQQNYPLDADTPADPDHIGKFVVTLEPIASGKTGRAIIAGITPAQIYLASEEDAALPTADITDEDTTQLTPTASGSAQILWVDEPEDGYPDTVWGLVRLGNMPTTPATTGYGKAQYDWEQNGGDYRVSVKSCSRTGGDVTGDAFWVYLPVSDAQHPAVYGPDSPFTGDVILWETDPFGTRVCKGTGAPKIHSTMVWTDADTGGQPQNIPRGWRLCDGQNGAPDTRGRTVKGLDTQDGAAANEDAMGDTGGFRWHGKADHGNDAVNPEGDNNHPGHDNHVHWLNPDTVEVTETPGSGVRAWADTLPFATAGMDSNPAGNLPDNANAHAGPFNASKDTDNRSPFIVEAWIERFK